MRLRARSAIGISAAVATLILIVPHSANSETALSSEAQRGHAIVRAKCARCHAVEKVGSSPLKAAPPFRTLHSRYPVQSLEESLAEGIVTGHPAMPEFQFDSEQVGEVIAYLKSLEH
ncbi:MAG TPA: cytochrome c [Xanthobacteraceae bacterium]|nr:cytochrome c [Xanthobacteraceae bacterium]